MARRMLSLAIAAAAAFALTGAGPAQAYPDAQVDQQIRPNFGVLLQPPLKHKYRPRAWGPRRPGGGGYGHGGQRPSRNLNAISVDCAAGGPGMLNQAVYDLADKGVLYIRSGPACVDTLEITHPIVVVGESLPSFAPGPAPVRARLTAPAGQPCIRVAPGVKGVVIRDLVIDGSQSGRSACIEALDADLAMDRTRVIYAGDASAIFVEGGQIIITNSTIDARTNEAAITVEAGRLCMERSRVVADVRGIDLIPAAGQGSELIQVGVIAQGGTLPGSTGVTVRDLRSGSGTLLIDNAVIMGWQTGVYVDRGAKVEIVQTRILKARRAVVSDWGNVTLAKSLFQSDERAAVFAGAGSKPVVHFNRFLGGGVTYESGIVPDAQPNWIYQANCNGFPHGSNGTFCRLNYDIPRGMDDQYGFEDVEAGWAADGYRLGYVRDGQPTVCRPGPQPPGPKRKPRRGAPQPPPPIIPPICGY